MMNMNPFTFLLDSFLINTAQVIQVRSIGAIDDCNGHWNEY